MAHAAVRMTITAELALPPEVAYMTAEELTATEAFYDNLLDEWFDVVRAGIDVAFGGGDREAKEAARDRMRDLYREIKEVEHALESNTLPF